MGVESIPEAARLRQVAVAAGVSVSTASRVLSGSGSASPRAVAAVLAASERLGYRPNLVARGLRSRATGLAGIVVPGVGNPFFAELVEALESALRGVGLDMILGDSGGPPSGETQRLQTLVDRQVDGLILIPTGHHSSAEAVRRASLSVPIVQVDRQVDGFPADYVGVDNRLGIHLALSHLAAQGCRTIAFASDDATSSTGRSRSEAMHAAIAQLPELVLGPELLGSFTVGFGGKAARTLLDHTRLPDAVICGSDLIALGIVRELRAAGVSIPGDIKVTGFDGILFSELSDPPLTTVRQPIQDIANEAVRLLQARIHGDRTAAQRIEIAPTLVVRRSTSMDRQ
jgi:LacI family transcriptional regulator, galactose operon repressor